MKKILVGSLLFSSLFCQSQDGKFEWTPSTIVMSDGSSIESLIALNDDFYDGVLIVKEGEKYLALPPIKIKGFSVLSPEGDSIKFHSKLTRFIKRSGTKKSLLKEHFVGEQYSVFSKHIPDKKTTVFILPYGIGTAYGVIQTLEDEEVIFLSKDDIAYQISLPFKEERYGKKFKIEKYIFKQILGEDVNGVNEVMKLRKLKLNHLEDFIQIIKFADELNN